MYMYMYIVYVYVYVHVYLYVCRPIMLAVVSQYTHTTHTLL